jgi:proteasome lid subunit RPN8/RPN11
MPKPLIVQVSQELLNTILEGARTLHPRENILLLRGKKKKDTIEISELVIPPLAAHGSHFVTFASHMLPIDFSIIGTAHSHPSGQLRPSPADLNHFFGAVLMIVGFPYADENNVSVYRSDGEKLGLQVTDSKAEPC